MRTVFWFGETLPQSAASKGVQKSPWFCNIGVKYEQDAKSKKIANQIQETESVSLHGLAHRFANSTSPMRQL